MKLNISTTLKDYKGEDITWQTERQGKIVLEPVTLKTCFIEALNNLAPTGDITQPNEIQTAETKAKIYGLSVKLYNSNEINLTPDDVLFLKERVGKIWNALVFGRICDIFDGNIANSSAN